MMNMTNCRFYTVKHGQDPRRLKQQQNCQKLKITPHHTTPELIIYPNLNIILLYDCFCNIYKLILCINCGGGIKKARQTKIFDKFSKKITLPIA